MKRLAVMLLLALALVVSAALLRGPEGASGPRSKSLGAASVQVSGERPAQGPIRRAPTPPHGHGASSSEQSYNWAGYDATGGGFTSVSASWTQPTVQADAATDSVASFWVGLDGDGSDTVEQLGTQAENDHGTVTYSAWWEMYPDYETPIATMTVSAGDLMTATVTAGGSATFTLALTDHTSGTYFTTTQHSAVAKGYSAEVIAEAPTNGQTNTEYPLPEFGTVDFSGSAFNGQPISAFAYNQIDMVSQGSGATLAATSPLGADGASFSVTSHPGTAPAPTLGSFTPTSGSVGTRVTLNGTGLSGATGVRFNGVAASFSVVSASKVTANVPGGATSGPISVTTPGGTATSTATFTVVPALTLAAFAPASGPVSSLVTLTGTGFGRATAVAFNGVSASFLVTSDAEITATVPRGATSGPISVTTPEDIAVSASGFTVLPTAARLSLRLGGLRHGSLRLGRSVSMTGTVTPVSLAGNVVRFTLQRRRSSGWATIVSMARATGNDGVCRAKFTPARRGAYRVKATTAETGSSGAASTAWHVFTVS